MEVRFVVNRVFNSCSYVVTQGPSSWLVDCGDVQEILSLVTGSLSGVLLTHSHFDHIYGLNRLLGLFPQLPVFTNQAGREGLLSDKLNLSRYHEEPFVLDKPGNIQVVEDGQQVALFDGINARAVFTPGHSPSCVTWLIGNAVFSGDSFIPGVKTVTNFPHADKQLAAQSEVCIRRMATGREIYAGHAPQLIENEKNNCII